MRDAAFKGVPTASLGLVHRTPVWHCCENSSGDRVLEINVAACRLDLTMPGSLHVPHSSRSFERGCVFLCLGGFGSPDMDDLYQLCCHARYRKPFGRNSTNIRSYGQAPTDSKGRVLPGLRPSAASGRIPSTGHTRLRWAFRHVHCMKVTVSEVGDGAEECRAAALLLPASGHWKTMLRLSSHVVAS